MFKLLILYTFYLAPGFPLQQAEVTGPFKTLKGCQLYAQAIGETLKKRPDVIMSTAKWECQEEDK